MFFCTTSFFGFHQTFMQLRMYKRSSNLLELWHIFFVAKESNVFEALQLLLFLRSMIKNLLWNKGNCFSAKKIEVFF